MTRRALDRALPRRARDLPLADIVLVDDAAMLRLARQFRGSRRTTDVLAFPYGAGELMGEVAVNLDAARRQARERGVPLWHELALLCVHGLLHIAGQGDETARDWCRMRVAEFETMARIL